MKKGESVAFLRLIEVCRRLMADDGCPWDREQSLQSITPYLQEEVYEVCEAVGNGDGDAIREELGDLFYLAVFASALGVKAGLATSLDDTLNGVTDKLIRRHPHVFGDESLADSKAAVKQWEEIKKGEADTGTILGKRPGGLPALTAAFRTQEKAAAVRFEWTDVSGALDKIREELEELGLALRDPSYSGPNGLVDEIGDILYSVVNVSRYLRVDPELALRSTIDKFTRRFQYVEGELGKRGKSPAESSLEEMDALWNEAKERGIR
jgi:MazG family protein